MLGDKLEMMTPQGNLHFVLECMEDSKGETVDVAPGDGHVMYIPVPAAVNLAYALLMRFLDSGDTKTAIIKQVG